MFHKRFVKANGWVTKITGKENRSNFVERRTEKKMFKKFEKNEDHRASHISQLTKKYVKNKERMKWNRLQLYVGYRVTPKPVVAIGE